MEARYEILPGLPSTGPMPEQFSATGMGKHSEGFVVRFHSSAGDPWVGNFQGGLGECEGVYREPGLRHLIVVSAGQAYVVDPEERALVRTFGGGICHVLPVPDLELLVFDNGIWLEGMGASGLAWKTRRLSWDGFRELRVAGSSLFGEAYTPMGDSWHEFEVDLETGEAVGGSYNGP
ncbi:hypothetical protein [Posidoniimonas polymericola]|nr:hypothetical protein [Posidoniimonas polymericola]